MSKSGMTHKFSMIPQANINRSTFQHPMRHITTFDSDVLIPFYVDEVLPGDTAHIHSKIFVRAATLKKPIMDNVKLDTFYFYVPNRLLWKNWQAFMGEQDDPLSPVEYEVPHYNSGTGFRTRQLEDYFGIPVGVANLDVNSLHSRAYFKIWNEWFRDENLCEKEFECTGDTDVDNQTPPQPVSYRLKARGKRHDYFTSCLPWPQKGPGVDLPIGDMAPVFGNGKALGLRGADDTNTPYNMGLGINQSGRDLTVATGALNVDLGSSYTTYVNAKLGTTVGVIPKAALDANQYARTGLYADLSEATFAKVSTLRTAMQLQIMLERDARGGTRYTEIIRAHFGVVSPDARLQRPEYLGGSNSTMGIYPVIQTSSTVKGAAGDVESPQANLSAMAQIINDSGFSKSFTEHGVIIGLMCITADLTYQQGLPRMFSRVTKYDFYWPALAHIGEQAVLNKEIFAQGASVIHGTTGIPYDDEVFGYQERYAEYRYGRNIISGDMRSVVTTPESSGSLDIWHLSEQFGNLPSLNEVFMTSSTPMKRVQAIPGTAENPEPDFIADILIDWKMNRPMPTFGVPGLMDHF